MKTDERNSYYFPGCKCCSGAWVRVSTLLTCILLQTKWVSATRGKRGRVTSLFSAIVVGKQVGRKRSALEIELWNLSGSKKDCKKQKDCKIVHEWISVATSCWRQGRWRLQDLPKQDCASSAAHVKGSILSAC